MLIVRTYILNISHCGVQIFGLHGRPFAKKSMYKRTCLDHLGLFIFSNGPNWKFTRNEESIQDGAPYLTFSCLISYK